MMYLIGMQMSLPIKLYEKQCPFLQARPLFLNICVLFENMQKQTKIFYIFCIMYLFAIYLRARNALKWDETGYVALQLLPCNKLPAQFSQIIFHLISTKIMCNDPYH